MVNLESRLNEIKAMIDKGEYFTINRARQYGKTTTLRALSDYLQNEYYVISLDFQKMSFSDFENESAFVSGLAREVLSRSRQLTDIPDKFKFRLIQLENEKCHYAKMAEIFDCFSDWCGHSPKPIVLIIDEVDTATNNQIFLDFLAQLRAAYLDRDITPTFQSVILAGVYDVRNIQRKLRPEESHKVNSPWNIAAKFRINMSFSSKEIEEMLNEYENDHHTGMDLPKIAEVIYNHTSGYPYLVSSLCKYIDEEIAGTENFPGKKQAWTEDGVFEAVKLLIAENNTLFQSLIGKLNDYPELRAVLYELLFTGKPIPYVPQNQYIDVATMFGFIKNDNGFVVVSNHIVCLFLKNLLQETMIEKEENYKSI